MPPSAEASFAARKTVDSLLMAKMIARMQTDMQDLATARVSASWATCGTLCSRRNVSCSRRRCRLASAAEHAGRSRSSTGRRALRDGFVPSFCPPIPSSTVSRLHQPSAVNPRNATSERDQHDVRGTQEGLGVCLARVDPPAPRPRAHRGDLGLRSGGARVPLGCAADGEDRKHRGGHASREASGGRWPTPINQSTRKPQATSNACSISCQRATGNSVITAPSLLRWTNAT